MNARGFNFELLPGWSSGTLLLLHGTGGDADDLLPLGCALDPAAALLSPRGQVSETGARRFFRRLAEVVFDEAEVTALAEELAQLAREVANTRRLDQIMAIGYSNWANIALAMMLLGVMRFDRAILFRPMVPPSRLPSEVDLDSQCVFIAAGEFNPIANVVQVNALAKLLRERGAEVEVAVLRSGHQLTGADLEIARDWLAGAAIA